MEILEKIQNHLKEAQKAGESIVIDTLRLLLAEIHNYEIKKRGEGNNVLSAEEIVQIIQKEVKKRKEALEFFKKAQRNDLVQKTQKELEVLSLYAPQLLSEEEILNILDDLIKQGFTDFNSLMKEVMQKYKGRVDGALVAKLIKQKLN
jgi:uncharacterized protein YqeY